jgi:AraC family transcriptional regulator
MSRADSLELDFRQAGTVPDVVRSSRWRGIQVEFSRLHLPAEYQFTWSGTAHYLALHDLALADGEMEVDDIAPIPGRDLRNKMTYVPASCGLRGWAKPIPRQNTFTIVYFEPAVLEQEIQEGVDEPLRPLIYFDAPELIATMKKLEAVMPDMDAHPSSIYAETLGLVAALETFRLQRSLPGKAMRAGVLTARQQRLVLDYIEEHLAEDFGLDALAAVAGLSRYHFSRRFKATFGLPPHRYVVQCRIERAKRLLAETRLLLADIAAASGFNSTANFIRTFRELQGATPGDYRRAI